jgi:hypothetical protein
MLRAFDDVVVGIEPARPAESASAESENAALLRAVRTAGTQVVVGDAQRVGWTWREVAWGFEGVGHDDGQSIGKAVSKRPHTLPPVYDVRDTAKPRGKGHRSAPSPAADSRGHIMKKAPGPWSRSFLEDQKKTSEPHRLQTFSLMRTASSGVVTRRTAAATSGRRSEANQR